MNVKNELFKRPVQHRPAPGDGLIIFEKHANRNNFHKTAGCASRQLVPARIVFTPYRGRNVYGRGNNEVIQSGGGFRNAHESRDREAVHIRVDNADGKTPRSKRRREICGHGGFPHASLTGNHPEDAGERSGRGKGIGAFGLEPGFEGAALFGVHSTKLKLHAIDAGDGGSRLAHLGVDCVLERASLNGQQNFHLGIVPLRVVFFGENPGIFHHAKFGDRTAQLGVFHSRERRPERILQGIIGRRFVFAGTIVRCGVRATHGISSARS